MEMSEKNRDSGVTIISVGSSYTGCSLYEMGDNLLLVLSVNPRGSSVPASSLALCTRAKSSIHGHRDHVST